jgi:lysozyme
MVSRSTIEYKVINQEGLNIIKKWEKCHLKAYRCPSGVLTIGWGHTSDAFYRVESSSVITQEFADRLLLHDLKEAVAIVKTQIKRLLNSNQFSSLVSIAYNSGNFTGTEFQRLMNEGQEVSELIKSYKIKSNGRTLQGLVNRRLDEYNLFIKPTVVTPDPPIKPLDKI